MIRLDETHADSGYQVAQRQRLVELVRIDGRRPWSLVDGRPETVARRPRGHEQSHGAPRTTNTLICLESRYTSTQHERTYRNPPGSDMKHDELGKESPRSIFI